MINLHPPTQNNQSVKAPYTHVRKTAVHAVFSVQHLQRCFNVFDYTTCKNYSWEVQNAYSALFIGSSSIIITTF